MSEVEDNNVTFLGVLHNRTAYVEYLGESGVFEQVFVCNIKHGIFEGTYEDPRVIIGAAILWAGNIMSINPAQRITRSDIITGVTGDLAGLMISSDKIMGSDEARLHVIKCMNILTMSENIASFTTLELTPLAPNIERYANFNQAYAGLLELINNCTRMVDISGASILAHIYLAIMKRGTLTLATVEKVQQGILDDCGQRIVLDIAACKSIYKYFGNNIDDTNIANIVETLSSLLPPNAIRMKQTLTQAAGSGITSILIIGRAISLFRSFKWSVIKRMYPDEWTKLLTALNVLNGNEWYGFRKDLGPVRSTAYKSIAYVCKELLIKVNGEATLNQYSGWVKTVAGKTHIDMMIAEYAENYTTRKIDPNTQEIIDEHNEEVTQIDPLLNINVMLFL